MLKSTHFGACSDAMQQVHGAGVKSNTLFGFLCIFLQDKLIKLQKYYGTGFQIPVSFLDVF